ncbi:MAG: chemotaxis protein CheW [Clostridia bacterium]|jgi:purine-binding chemotaxis protein CheW|nr:chemotaxis protein CheW [Clostridia bacterium]
MAQAEVLDIQEQEEDTLKGKYLIFSMGKELYGMEIRYITEIIGIQPITVVPEMPAYVKGITNLRGKIIPVIDARLRFKKEVREYDDRTCIIVLDTNGLSVGLVVDSVSEVISMKDEDIAPPPEISKGGHKYIKGVGKAGGSVKLLLDCRKMLNDDEVEALSTIG